MKVLMVEPGKSPYAAAVSYTHLDVYKRQLLTHKCLVLSHILVIKYEG